MTAPAGTMQTYQQVGIREQLADMIYDISPTETPFLSNAKRGKATNRKAEWQLDALADANGDNKTIEGDDATTDTAVATTRLNNYTQLMDKVVRTSSTADAVSTAGRKKELSYQITKRSKELKRDMEARLTGNYASTAGVAASARELGGLESWYATNVNRGSNASAETNGASGGFSSTTGVTVAATDASATAQRTFTEALLKDVIRQCWDSGGDPTMVMVGGFNKQKASAFSGIASLYRDTNGKNSAKQISIIGGADLYISDFGEHKIVPNRFSRARTAHVLDMDYWEVQYLQPFKIEPLAKTGHSERRMISVEFTLCSKNEAASGVVADLTTS